MSDIQALIQSETQKLQEDLGRLRDLKTEHDAAESEATDALVDLALNREQRGQLIQYVRQNLLEFRAFVTGREDQLPNEVEWLENMERAYFEQDPMAGAPNVTISSEGEITIEVDEGTGDSQPDNQDHVDQ